MNPNKLTLKTISGKGCYHQFRNNLNDEIVYVKCTQSDYDRMGLAGGAQYNPTLADHLWLSSSGGVPEVEGRMLKDREYIEIDSMKIAKIGKQTVKLEEGDLDRDSNFIGVIEQK